LSDGEYQLLSLFAIVDLFDSESTLFLLDEIDTHVHYTLIKQVWNLLKCVKGNILTSTHILDSVLNNKFSSIRYVKNGSISDNYILAEIITRIEDLSARKEFQFAIAAKSENILLIDNINDLNIFYQLFNNYFKDISDKWKSILLSEFDRIYERKIYNYNFNYNYKMISNDIWKSIKTNINKNYKML